MWRRRLFVWKEELIVGLRVALPSLVLSDVEDDWSWLPGEMGMFSVHSVYFTLGLVLPPVVVFSEFELEVFSNMWKSPAPSKVLAFSWKLLRNRIPTKSNLLIRGVLNEVGGLNCVHCHGREEDVCHLFIFCDFASKVWNAIFRWLGIILVLPPDLFILFDYFTAAAPTKKMGKGFALIWHATVWSIWRSRNDLSFANGVVDVLKVVDDIKVLSWRWGLSRRKISICLFYEWCWDLGLCLRR
jgi:hypothetical protein